MTRWTLHNLALLGLTLGKFAPLHKGHQFLFESALAKVDKLVVVIYACCELPECPAEQRAAWIKTLYPQIEIVLAPDGPKETGYTKCIMTMQDNYLKSILKGYQFDFFFSSEPYGDHVSKALRCEDMRIDQSRSNVPISATEIRQDIVKYKEYLSPLVFNALMPPIATTSENS